MTSRIALVRMLGKKIVVTHPRGCVATNAAAMCRHPMVLCQTSPSPPLTRCQSTIPSATTGEEEIDRDDGYVSKLQEYFNRSAEGVTALGTTKFRPDQSRMLECGIFEDDLRFKTTCYGRLMLPPYVQPQEHQVTVKIPWSKIPLNELEKRILAEIVGSRYNVERQMLQLKSDQFGSRIENKRHLVTMLNRLVFAARRLALQVQEEMENTPFGSSSGATSHTSGTESA